MHNKLLFFFFILLLINKSYAGLRYSFDALDKAVIQSAIPSSLDIYSLISFSRVNKDLYHQFGSLEKKESIIRLQLEKIILCPYIRIHIQKELKALTEQDEQELRYSKKILDILYETKSHCDVDHLNPEYEYDGCTAKLCNVSNLKLYWQEFLSSSDGRSWRYYADQFSYLVHIPRVKRNLLSFSFLENKPINKNYLIQKLCMIGDLDILEHLVGQKNDDLNHAIMFGYAGEFGQCSLAYALLEKYSFKSVNQNALFLFNTALSNCYFKLLKKLIEKAANFNYMQEHLERTFFNGCCYGKTEFIKRLLDSNVDPNIVFKQAGFYNKFTPLHIAVDHSELELTKLLLEKGAKQNMYDRYGRTPLDLCTDEKIKKILLKYANVSHKSSGDKIWKAGPILGLLIFLSYCIYKNIILEFNLTQFITN